MSRAKNDAIFELLMELSGGGFEGDFVEHVQNREQDTTSNLCQLPKDMNPSKEAFEKLGFKFHDTGDDVLYDAELPEGWTIKRQYSSSILHADLVDETGKPRGHYCYKGAFYDRYGSMYLFRE